MNKRIFDKYLILIFGINSCLKVECVLIVGLEESAKYIIDLKFLSY